MRGHPRTLQRNLFRGHKSQSLTHLTERPKHRRTVSPAGTNTQSNVLTSELGIDGVVWHVAELLETAMQVAAVGSVKARGLISFAAS